MKKALLLVLLSLFIPLTIASAKANFTGVPKKCEALLTEFARANGESLLKPKIDWSEIRKNMGGLGYSDYVVGKKLNDIGFDQQQMFDRIRSNTGAYSWTWKRPFSENMQEKFGAAEGRSSNADSFLMELPLWSSIKGVNIPLIVNSLLKAKEDQIDETEQKYFSFYAPLWMEGPLALENAKLFYQKSGEGEQNVATKWLNWNLPERIRPQLTRFLQQKIAADYRNKRRSEDRAMEDLKAVAALPWRQLPANLKRHLEKNWVDVKTYPPIKLDSIHHISRGYHDAGNCEYMANGHMKSLALAERKNCKRGFNDFEDHKSSVLIEVQGKLVGSLKRLGDHSMLALRNVYDGNGRLVLAIGGVYHLGQGIYDSLPRSNRNGRWARVNLDQLLVHPHTFLLNDNGWEGDINTNLLRRVGLDHFTKEELIEALEDSNGYSSSELDSEKRPQIWNALLENIDRVRQKQER